MTILVLEGGHILTPIEERFTNLWVRDNKIAELSDRKAQDESGAKSLNVQDCYVTPGLIDLQVNGDSSCDLWADPSASALTDLRTNLVKNGVTGFLPTLTTDDIEHMQKNIAFLRSQGVLARNQDVLDQSILDQSGKSFDVTGGATGMARMLGIHLEGPCLSPAKPGVHPVQWLKPLNRELMSKLAGDVVALITLAPELEPGGETITYLIEQGIKVSLGHSNATYEEAKLAFRHGVRMITHTFNALPTLNHRAPGAIAAAMRNCHIACCVICDGLHVDPVMVGMLIRYIGVARTILVSDLAFIGTSQGGLVGSSLALADAVRNIVKWDIASFVDAVKMATFNPAQAIGRLDTIGQLASGKAADVLVWDKKSLALRHVIVNGQTVF